MGTKTKALILFGGQSAEHEVSLQSGRNVVRALDRDRFDPICVGITSNGSWLQYEDENFLLNPDDPKTIALAPCKKRVTLVRNGDGRVELADLSGSAAPVAVDVVFPVMHGTFCEDGTLQGWLKVVGVPFVGAGVLGSSVAMDKDVMKRLFTHAGIPNARGRVFLSKEQALSAFAEVSAELGTPVFVKPANLGSSVGISRATNESEFRESIDLAFRYDLKVLVEEAIVGREIECAVLGNLEKRASELGEIVPSEKHGFYSYDAKYIDEDGAALIAPAEVEDPVKQQIQKFAIQACDVLCCEGMARVDFFLTPDGKILINEINTIPGFTKVSMYPRLWQLTGVPYSDLITELLELALERAAREQSLQTVNAEL